MGAKIGVVLGFMELTSVECMHTHIHIHTTKGAQTSMLSVSANLEDQNVVGEMGQTEGLM